MEQVELSAEVREQLGKGPVRRLKREGLIPSVLYGPKTRPIPLTLNYKEIQNILSKAAGTNVLISLRIGQGDQVDVKTVMIKEYQLDSLRSTLIHADLYEVSMDKKITVMVPINIEGKAPGIEQGGSLSQINREVEIECLPSDIPDKIDVDISNLDMGDSVHVSDLVIKEGMEILTDKKTALVTIVAPMAEEVEVKEEELEEEVEAEAEAKEGEEVAETAKPETKE
jgi:large subunit ribosomal protein L25